MKRITFLLVLLPSLCHSFEFYHGSIAYNSGNISDQISEQYGGDFKINIVLVAANKQGQETSRLQWHEIDKLDAESLQLIYVSAVTFEERKGGYYTSTDTARNLLRDKEFKLLLITSDGATVLDSSKLISAEEISLRLTQHNNEL